MIRKATEQDIAGIMALYEDYIEQHIALDENLAPFHKEDTTYPNYLLSLLHSDKGLLLVSTTGFSVNGYLLGTISVLPPVFKTRQKLNIQDLAVGAAWHRKGIGRALVNECTAWAQAQHIKLVELHVHAKNETAYSFWQSMGFKLNSLHLRKNL